ncbi:hypothetical protein VTN49DRAFT_4565 [Thermomyces lanuginosus]|uniref:uncharacterized protein n=1 Tax=Thermomyces lanuginosus TaxID=5541 RepID=UPI003743C7E4
MAANIPNSLKSADIARFVTRAAQLERAKPVIAYWCNYWVVDQVISKGLHNSDEEAMQFTTKLMDKLERFKSENSDNEAVTDNVVAKAYVEQFGHEVFNRADNAVRANKASKQTADTFHAAATFLELLQIWGELDPDVASKIKFAKYHAVRIAKAIKNGEDPNLSNPTQAPASEDGKALDPNDPEVRALQGTGPAPAGSAPSRQPTVEDAPDEDDQAQPRLARQSIHDESLHPSRSSSIPRQPAPAPSPPARDNAVPDLPSAPGGVSLPSRSGSLPSTPGVFPSAPSGDGFQSFPAPLTTPQPGVPGPPTAPETYYSQPTPAPAVAPSQAASAAPVPPSAPTSAQEVDDQAISQAQKHARFAVSALTFDDVPTAIKELRIALRFLGAE